MYLKNISKILIITLLTFFNYSFICYAFAGSNNYLEISNSIIMYHKLIGNATQKLDIYKNDQKEIDKIILTSISNKIKIEKEVDKLCVGLLSKNINDNDLNQIITTFEKNIYYTYYTLPFIKALKTYAVTNNISKSSNITIENFINYYNSYYNNNNKLERCDKWRLSCGCVAICCALATGYIYYQSMLIYLSPHTPANPPAININNNNDDHHDQDGMDNQPDDDPQDSSNIPPHEFIPAFNN